MKQLLIIIICIVTLSSCCSLTREREYKSPESKGIENYVVVPESKDRVWNRIIKELKSPYSPFTINSMDKDKGHIQISYSGTPCPYVDCGDLSAEFNNTGRMFDPPFSTPLLFRNTYPACTEFLEFTVCEDTDVPWKSCNMTYKRSMWLELSAYIEFDQVSGGIEVTVAPSYEVTKKVKVYNQDNGYFIGQTYESIVFSTYSSGTFPDQTTCVSNGTFENQILGVAK